MSTDGDTLEAIAFLGVGSMAGAILAGLISAGVEVTGGIRTTNRSAAHAAALARLPQVTAYAVEDDPAANRRAVAGARTVLLGVKPAMVPDVLADIAEVLTPGTLVMSVAAGVTIATCESLLPAGVAVIRAMPNTPALVGKAVTGISAGTRSSSADLALAVSLFKRVGETLVVPESQLDALSTISGSGPAYVFLLIEALTEVARQKGFSPAEAETMVQGTFLGAAELLAASDVSPAELRRRVTSPGGTTERAIAVLQGADVEQIFARATDAAMERARELAAGS